MSIIDTLRKFGKLKHITFCLDGICCTGKLLQQYVRRKTSSYFMNKEGKCLLSDSMIIPGSKLVRMFGSNVIEMFKETFQSRCSLIFSLDNIGSEGEHKMLDFYRHSTYINERQPCLVWSDDSDVPVCLLSNRTHEVYAKTKITKYQRGVDGNEGKMINEERIYHIADLRISLCSDHIDRLNCQMLIAFFGNDFLPEMLNTIDLKKTFTALRRGTIRPDNTKILFTTPQGFFNASAFLEYLNNFDDFAFYFADMGYTSAMYSQTEMYQFMEMYQAKPGNDIETKRNFKRFYYTNVMREELRTLGETMPSDQQVYEFEMDMAFSYLQVFIWYYYYSNGYYLSLVNGRTFEPYYKYNFPPLFNSMKKLLRNPTLIVGNNSFLTCLDDLLNIRPMRRTPAYASRIPRWIGSNLPQCFAVLQRKDLSILLNEENQVALEARKPFEELYPIDPEKSMFIRTRIFKRLNLPNVEGSPTGTKGKKSFTVNNHGIKVYPKFDISDIMDKAGKLLGLTLSNEYTAPLIIGNVEQTELTDFKDTNFSVGEEIVL